MSTKSLVIGTIGAGCIAAAGLGGYVAARVAPVEDAAAPLTVASAQQPAVTLPEPSAAVTGPSARPSTQRSEPAGTPARTARRPAARPVPPATPSNVPARPAAPPPLLEPDTTWDAPPVAADAPASLPPVTPVVTRPLPEPVEPEPPRFIELTVEEDAVIGIRLESAVSSETAEIEDRVVARVTRDVMVAGRTAIPAGARLEGTVTLVERGGSFRERARLGIRFTELVLSDSSTVRLQTEAIFRDGESPTGEATSKVGASAVIGAILGGVIGGKKGAVIGGTAGAAGGTAVVMKGGPNAATLDEGTPLTVQLTQPVTLLIERDDAR